MSLSNILRRFINLIYSGYISAHGKNINKSTVIDYTSSIIGPEFLSTGKNCVIGKRCVISSWHKYKDKVYSPEIRLSDNVLIGDDCHITAISRILIGQGTLLGKKITITDNSHGSTNESDLQVRPILRNLVSKGDVMIGDNVWIGDKVTILPNVNIGNNSVIGANSVVTHDIPSFSVACGNPARVIKYGVN